MTKFLWLAVIGLITFSCSKLLVESESLLADLMQRHPAKFKRIIRDKDTLEVQIIYTQINRDSLNRPIFKSFYFHVDSTKYFYPASTVKLPMVLLAFEKLNQLNIKGLDKYTPMFNDSVYSGQLSVKKDTTSESGLPSIAHYAKKILLVSDNDASNRLYEFVGQKEVNATLKRKGYNMRILHRLERALKPDQNRHTEAVRFMRNDSITYSQPMLFNPDSIRAPRNVFKGRGYMSGNKRVDKPFDFTYKNFYPLQDQQEILKAILFPESSDPKRRFDITDADRTFIKKYMSQLPRETKYPAYFKDKAYTDSYCKFLLFGESKRKIPSNIRIFNKVGDAYGFLLDNAYIVDFKNHVEFMLSAVINTNTDAIYNDSKYEYHKIGFPFMRNLGKAVYKYELKRRRVRKPDLSSFQMKYDQ